MRVAGIVAALSLTLLTGGCTLLPVAPDTTPLAARPYAATFEFEGRISASDGNRAANGQLLWTRRPGRDEWTLLSPLGQIVARMTGTADGATLRTADGQQVEAPDVSTLLPQILGVAAPADHLAEWIQAIPADGARVLDRDASGRPLRIADSGWTIDYLQYLDDSATAPPRRIEATWGEVRLRIVTDQWTVTE